MLICIWVTVLSFLLILAIEKDLVHRTGKPLPRWRRYLIPIPILLMLASNLDGVLSFGVWAEAHPGSSYLRYSDNNAWDPDRFLTAGFWSAICLAPLLCAQAKHIVIFTSLHWACHIAWLFLVLLPLMLSTGFPLNQD